MRGELSLFIVNWCKRSSNGPGFLISRCGCVEAIRRVPCTHPRPIQSGNSVFQRGGHHVRTPFSINRETGPSFESKPSREGPAASHTQTTAGIYRYTRFEFGHGPESVGRHHAVEEQRRRRKGPCQPAGAAVPS